MHLFSRGILETIVHMLYKSLLRPALFSFDSEAVHDTSFSLIGALQKLSLDKALSVFTHYEDQRLAQTICGLRFLNPIGLAAGFDKNGAAIPFFSALGFGHVEIGTVTAKPQQGNPKPRIFRLEQDDALINRMGFPSRGADFVAEHLQKQHGRKKSIQTLLGINVGKTKVTPIDDAADDYCYSLSTLETFGDYFVINISSPNTPELRKLQEKERLHGLLVRISEVNTSGKPVFIKLAPDLTHSELDDILSICFEMDIDGIISTNTTFARDNLTSPSVLANETGGLSGKPLRLRSLDIIRYLHRKITDNTTIQNSQKEIATGKKPRTIPIIGVGGISTTQDVVDTLRSGASLVQIYTSLVYEGPFLVNKLKRGLIDYMNKNGIKNISEMIGQSQ